MGVGKTCRKIALFFGGLLAAAGAFLLLKGKNSNEIILEAEKESLRVKEDVEAKLEKTDAIDLVVNSDTVDKHVVAVSRNKRRLRRRANSAINDVLRENGSSNN